MNGDLKIFCVSNTDYQKHRDDNSPVAQRHTALSGVVELRLYCQSIPAEAQFKAVVEFLEHKVPTLLGSIRQWLLQGSDDMTVEKANQFQRLVDQCDERLNKVCPGTLLQVRQILTAAVDFSTLQSAKEPPR